MGKRAIILSMSCEQERYINEEEVIRQTWGKSIIENKFPNISLYFFRGGNKNAYDEEKQVVHLKSDDSLEETFNKTKEMFKWVNENCGEYDYIIRTNTSTYLNMDAISQFLELDDIEDDVMYGRGLVINGSAHGLPFLRGNFLIIPKKIVNIIMGYVVKGIDDVCIAQILWTHYQGEYFSHIREIDGVVSMKWKYFNDLPKSFFVRLIDKENEDNNIVNMIGLHALYKNVIPKTTISKPHNFTNIDTLYGFIPI